MIIRKADLEADALAIIDGARDFMQRIAFRSLLPRNYDDFVAAIGRIVTLEGLEILLAEHDGRVVGGIGILYAPYMWDPDKLVADELFFWSHQQAPFRTARMLIDETMNRIREKGAIPMFRSLTTSPPGVERVYRKLGLEPVETVFTTVHE